MQTINTDRLIRDLHTVVLDAEELLKATAGNTNEKLVSMRTRMEESVREAKTSLEQAKQRTAAQVKAASHAADNYVHENPWRSMGIAASVGMLMGLLMNNRR